MKNRMQLDIESKPENIALCRLAVASFASLVDLTISDLEELKVVVSELVSNAIIHGYKNGPGIIKIKAAYCEEKFFLEIIDAGCGMADVVQAKEPSFTTAEGRMGLGLSFVESFMDQVDIESFPGRGTAVKMIKYLRANTDDR